MNPSLWSLSLGFVLAHLSVLLAPLTAVLNLDLLLYLPHQQPWYLMLWLSQVFSWGRNGLSAVEEEHGETLQKREEEAVIIPASGKNKPGIFQPP